MLRAQCTPKTTIVDTVTSCTKLAPLSMIPRPFSAWYAIYHLTSLNELNELQAVDNKDDLNQVTLGNATD